MYTDLTLGEFLSGSFDFGCYVEIYDCTNCDTWLDCTSPVVSSQVCELYEIEDVDPELLNARISYITINGRTLVIEVTK